MADKSKIEWTNATWNVITGCSVISPGCTNCYAMKLAGTRLRSHPSRRDLTDSSRSGPVWNGTVRFNEQWLTRPIEWSTPRMIFVVAHGDLFHENVPDEWIDQVFAVMAICPQHKFQVLTKRPERMEQYLTWVTGQDARINAIDRQIERLRPGRVIEKWPLPNVWLGVSAEDQQRAEERIPVLLRTPAAVRWVSMEPLLGPIDVEPWLGHRVQTGLDWVVVGGEATQPKRKARWMDPEWALDIMNECSEAYVPFFMKQMTNKEPIPQHLNWQEWPGE